METYPRGRSSVSRIAWIGGVLAVAAGCSNHMMDDESMNIPDVIELPVWEGTFESSVAQDLDPTDKVVEVRLEAKGADVEIAQGHRVRLWTYNGVLPGPRIEARAGDTVRVRFKN